MYQINHRFGNLYLAISKDDAYIAMFDRWNKTNLIDSRYLWLPIEFDGDRIRIEWRDKWKNFF